MATKPAPGTRDRILDTAGRLFYDHGIHAVGLQQVIDECGCGKNLLYREFPSKDELVVAYLERSRRGVGGDVRRDRSDRSPAIRPRSSSRIVRIDRRRGRGARLPRLPLPEHPRRVPRPRPSRRRRVRRLPTEVRARLRDLATRAGADDPTTLADRVMLIIDGLVSNGAVLGSNGAAPAAVALTEELVASSSTRTRSAVADR